MESFTYWGWMTESRERKLFSIFCSVLIVLLATLGWLNFGPMGSIAGLAIGILAFQMLIVMPQLLTTVVILVTLLEAASFTWDEVHGDIYTWSFLVMLEAAMAFMANSWINDIMKTRQIRH